MQVSQIRKQLTYYSPSISMGKYGLYKKWICFFSTVLLCINTVAQENKSDYLLSLRVNCSVPHTVANKALKKTFTGIYDLNASFNVNPFGGFITGVTVKNSLFNIPANKIAGLDKTTMQLNSLAVKIGYDHYLSETIFFGSCINLGENWTKFSSLPPLKTPHEETASKYSSVYIEPEINLNFLIENFFAIGLNISYQYISRPFDPYLIGMNDYATYYNNQLGKHVGLLNVGFGFYYGFAMKKR